MDPTYECKAADNAIKVQKNNDLLEDFGEPPIKIRRPSKISCEEKYNLNKSFTKLSNSLSQESDSKNNNNLEESWIKEFKQSLTKKTKRSDKLFLLTTLPADLSNRNIQKTFNVSRRMTRQAKKLR